MRTMKPAQYISSLHHALPAGMLRVRTVWISDIHLGTKGCQAQALLAFLRMVECDTLYLVGDIVDGWQLRRNWYWPQAHNDVAHQVQGVALHHAQKRQQGLGLTALGTQVNV